MWLVKPVSVPQHVVCDFRWGNWACILGVPPFLRFLWVGFSVVLKTHDSSGNLSRIDFKEYSGSDSQILTFRPAGQQSLALNVLSSSRNLALSVWPTEVLAHDLSSLYLKTFANSKEFNTIACKRVFKRYHLHPLNQDKNFQKNKQLHASSPSLTV